MKYKTGFTLVEMLGVLLIIGVLSSMAISGYGALQRTAKRTRAASAARQLTDAWELYLQKHRVYPILKLRTAGIGRDGDWYLTDKKFVSFKKQIELSYDTTADEDGTGVLDPWGEHYRFKLDQIYDGGNITGKVGHPDGTQQKGSVIVWSKGPDKQEGNKGSWPAEGKKPADDIVVW